jgi:hypothetical protein
MFVESIGMRLPLLISSILFWVVLTPSANAVSGLAEKSSKTRKSDIAIRVEGEGWGEADTEEVESVLHAVADELATWVPVRLPISIVVSHTDREPMVLYEKEGTGEYRVRLHAHDRRWGEYVYEFAHELCHIMSNYDAHRSRDSRKYNQWFEETLCETASLYTLRSMALTWSSAPPRPGLERYAARLNAFAQQLIMEEHRNLPDGTPLAEWLRENEEALRNDPYLREKNEIVAKLLLPLFEQDPENIDSLHYLNLDPAEARADLQQYLHAWYDSAPARHKTFVASILKLLGVETPLGVRVYVKPAAPKYPEGGAGSAGQAGPSKH